MSVSVVECNRARTRLLQVRVIYCSLEVFDCNDQLMNCKTKSSSNTKDNYDNEKQHRSQISVCGVGMKGNTENSNDKVYKSEYFLE